MNERKILKESINDHQAAIDKAKKELANLDKPKLRHGEKMTWGQYQDRILLYNKQSELVGYDSSGVQSAYPLPGTYKGTGETIFDDLRRNSEDLKEFEVKGCFKFKGTVTDDDEIWLYINTGSSVYNLDQVTEIHQKLGQIIAFAKRKALKTK